MKSVYKIILFLALTGTLKAQLNVKSYIDHVKPDGSDTLGNIYLTVTGGTSPYNYLWTPGGTTSKDLTNVTANTYTVRVRSTAGDSVFYKYKLGYKTYWTNYVSCFFRRDTLFGQTAAPYYPSSGYNTTIAKNTLKSGQDGWVQWVVNAVSGITSYVGFLDSISSAGTGLFSDIDYGIIQVNNSVYKSISGVNTPISTCIAGDVLRMERVGTVLTFYKNSSSIATFTVSNSKDWKVKAVLSATAYNNHIGASFLDSTNASIPNYVEDFPKISHCTPGSSNGSVKLTPKISGTTHSYTWSTSATTSSITGAAFGNYSVSIADSDGNLSKYTYNVGYKTYWTNFYGIKSRNDSLIFDSPASPYGHNTAISKNTLKAGTNGWAEVVIKNLSDAYYLAFVDSATNFEGVSGDMDYYVYLNTNKLYNGSTVYASYKVGDVIRLERVGSTFYIKVNGTSVFSQSCNTKNWKLKAYISSVAISDIGTSFADTSGIYFPNYVRAFPTIKHNSPGAGNGSINLTPMISGATQSYTWSPGGATTSSISGLSNGNYSVTINDADLNQSKYNYNIGYKTYWTNLYGTVFSNDSIKQTGAPGWNTAVSKNTLKAGTDGWVEIVIKNATDQYMLGFQDSSTVICGTYTDIDYGIYIQYNKLYSFLGSVTLLAGTKPGDIIRLERIGTSFKIRLNNYLLYSTTVSTLKDHKLKLGLYNCPANNIGCSFIDTTNITFPNYVQVSPEIIHSHNFNVADGSIKVTPYESNANYSFTWTPTATTGSVLTEAIKQTYTVQMADVNQNKSTGRYNVGFKPVWNTMSYLVSKNDTLYNAPGTPFGTWGTAVAKNILPANTDGYIEHVVATISGYENMVGFADSIYSTYNDLDYSIDQYYYNFYLRSNGTPTFMGYCRVGDVLRLERTGNTMYCKINGVSVYSFTVSTTMMNKNWKLKAVKYSTTPYFANIGCSFPTYINGTIEKEHADYDSPNNGSIAAYGYGGTPPYTYKWNDGSTDQIKTSLSPGTYTVVVKDSLENEQIGRVITIGVKPNWNIRKNIRITPDSTYMINRDSLGRLIGENYIKKNETGWYETTITNVTQDVAIGLIGLPDTYMDTTITPPAYPDTAMSRRSDLAYALMRKATRDSLVYGGGSNLLQLSSDYDQIYLARIKNGQVRPLFKNTPLTSVFGYAVGDVLKIGRDATGKVFLARNDTTLYTYGSSSATQYMYPSMLARTTTQTGKSGVSPQSLPLSPFSSCVNDNTKNWTSTREFDEYGNIVSEIREYFDNFGRPTQTQTKLIGENNILATEAIYDSHGRAVGQTLPAPLFSSYNCYAPTFFSNSSNTHYSLDNFDKPVTTSSLTGEVYNPSAVGNSVQGTLGWYYSNNNTVDGYVPADGYPYSRMQYYSEPLLNRFAKSGSPGAIHRFGMNHYKSATYTDGTLDLACLFPTGTYELDEDFKTKTYNVTALPPIQIMKNVKGIHKTTTCNEDNRCEENYTTEDGKLLATRVNGTDWTVYYYDIKGRLKAVMSPQDFVCGVAPTARIVKYDTTSYAFSCDSTSPVLSRSLMYLGADSTETAHYVSIELEPSLKYFDTLITRTSSQDFKLISNDSLVSRDTMIYYPPSAFVGDTVREISDTMYNPRFYLSRETDSMLYYNHEIYKNDVRARLTGKQISYSGKYVPGVMSGGSVTYYPDLAKTFNYDVMLADSGKSRIVYKLLSDKVTIDISDTILPGATSVFIKCTDLKIHLRGFGDVPEQDFDPCDTSWFVGEYDALLLSNINANINLTTRTNITTTPPPPSVALTFSRKYWYNEYDHLTGYENKDEGRTNYLYDLKEDKLMFSQNAQQLIDGAKFSYLKYDVLGRLTESGEFDPTQADGSASTNYKFQNYYDWKNGVSPGSGYVSCGFLAANNNMFLDFGGTRSTEEKYIAYDFADASNPLNSTLPQKYTGGNVSKTWNANCSTWYSYDETGKVMNVIQDMTGLGVKTLDYTYDMRGKLLGSIYQKNTSSDRFRHEYAYDLNERLKRCWYSRNISGGLDQIGGYYYYLHGPVKRMDVGNFIQGLDHVYTIGGLLKAVNNPNPFSDPGGDAGGTADVFSYALEYYPNDYERDYSYLNCYKTTGAYSNANVSYTGIANSIRWRTVYPSSAPAPSPNTISGPFMMEFDYDNFYRMKGATFGNYSTIPASGQVLGNVAFNATNSFSMSNMTYDKNGNILSLKRNADPGTATLMDDLSYNYLSPYFNRLNSVSDGVTASLGITADMDFPNQTSSTNYQYNAIGQVTVNLQDDQQYYYNSDGLVTMVKKNSNSNTIVEFIYNDKNQRQLKKSYNSSGTAILNTYYVYDESGALQATYDEDLTAADPVVSVKDFVMYGGGRKGVYDIGTAKPYFELTDHLGNIRAVITEASGNVSCVSYTDYYPHGGVMPGRSFIGTPVYRYNHQGKEKDGETNLINFELRQLDPRLGRWFNPDPYGQHHSPYLSMSNDPFNTIDPDGGWGVNNGWTGGTNGASGEEGYCQPQLPFDLPGGNSINYGGPTEGQQYAWNASNAEWVSTAEWKKKKDKTANLRTYLDNNPLPSITLNALAPTNRINTAPTFATYQPNYDPKPAVTPEVPLFTPKQVAFNVAVLSVGAIDPIPAEEAALAVIDVGFIVYNLGAGAYGITASGNSPLPSYFDLTKPAGATAVLQFSAEHTKGARPSTKGKHEKGQARKAIDRGGEKGDANRGYPRKRPPNHKGPWPPKK